MRTPYVTLGGLLASVVLFSHGQKTVQHSGTPVKFNNVDARAFDVVVAVGLQTHVPIGIIFGKNQKTLCEVHRFFHIDELAARAALEEAVRATGYSVEEMNGVLLIAAPDVTPAQRSLLDYRYDEFPGRTGTYMARMGFQLTGWMKMEAEHVTTFGGAISHSTTSEKIDMETIRHGSTEEIANRIVQHGSKGMWLFIASKVGPDGKTDESVDIYSYRDNEASFKSLSCNL